MNESRKVEHCSGFLYLIFFLLVKPVGRLDGRLGVEFINQLLYVVNTNGEFICSGTLNSLIGIVNILYGALKCPPIVEH